MYDMYNYAFSEKTGTHSGAKLLVGLAALLTAFLLLGSPCAHAVSVTVGDFTIERGRDRVVTVTEYSGPGGDVTLPASATINDVPYPVTTVKTKTFQGNQRITSLTIPEGYTELPADAFQGCAKLRSVNIPGSMLRLGANAFEGCTALETLTFDADTADSLKFSNAVFINCTSLKQVELPARLANLEAGNPFWGCTALDTVTVAPGSKTLFAENNLVYERQADGSAVLCVYPFGLPETRVTLPGSVNGMEVTALAPAVFRHNAVITDLTVPASVKTVERFAFEGCSALKNLTLLSETSITPNVSCFMGLAQGSVIHVPNDEVAASIGPKAEEWGGTTEFYDSARTTVVVGAAPTVNCDVNGDGIVDQVDITEAQRYYQETSQSEHWNQASKADVSGDGRVDLVDLVAIFRTLIDF